MSSPAVLEEREGMLVSIAGLLDRARAGSGGALFVVGEAGLGKTAVLDQAVQSTTAFRVGRARADERETTLPFGLFAQGFEALGVKHGLGDAEQAASAARTAGFYETLRHLGRLSPEPVLLALDDVHLADADSLALLSFLCRRLGSMPVAVVGTLRPWPPAGLEVASSLANEGHAALERLTPLSVRAAGELLSSRSGRSFSSATIRRATALCAGNPLLLEHLGLRLRPREAVPRPPERPSRAAASGLRLSHFAGLRAKEMRWAWAASVLAAEFCPVLAAEVAGLGDRETERAVEALCRGALVRPAADSLVEFVHPLFRQALYNELTPLMRARFHERAFTALVRRGMTVEAAEHAIPGRLAGNQEAIAVLEETGRVSLRAGPLRAAIRYLEAAVELAGAQAGPELLLALAQALLACGRPADAVGVCDRLRTYRNLSPQVWSETLRTAGRALHLTGAPELARVRFEEAASALQTTEPGAAIPALVDSTCQAWYTGGPAAALPRALQTRECAQSVTGSNRLRAEAACGFVAYMSGDAAGLEQIAIAARHLEADPLTELPDLCWMGGSLGSFGEVATVAERFDDAERSLGMALTTAEEVGADGAAARLAGDQAEMLLRRGKLSEALELAGRAQALARSAPWAEAFAGIRQANVLLHLGRIEESETWCARVEPRATAQGEWLTLLWLWHVRGRHAVYRGRPEEACQLYGSIEQMTAGLGLREPCLVPWAPHAVAAYLKCDREEDACRVVDWLERCGERLPCRWPQIATAMGRARLAERHGDRDGAERHWRVALALHEEVDLPLERVETLLDCGSLLLRGGEPSRARPLLGEALELAQGLGARWLAGIVAAEFAVARGRRRRPTDPERLTPQEQRVAQLAAEGGTNQKIARELSVTVKTVETHLTRVYAKLDIRSRHQLAATAIRGDDEPSPPSLS